MFDVSDLGSFNNVRNWAMEVDNYGKSGVGKVIVANKTDLPPAVDEATAGVRGIRGRHELGVVQAKRRRVQKRASVEDAMRAWRVDEGGGGRGC